MGDGKAIARKLLYEIHMAQVIWLKKADALFEKYIFNAFIEYGQATSKKWMTERIRMIDRLENCPSSFPPEPLLNNRKRCYRSCLILGRFKFVYYYLEPTDTVFIVDIWDTRMNPDNLKKRIKQ